jgi:hypothetical protein
LESPIRTDQLPGPSGILLRSDKKKAGSCREDPRRGSPPPRLASGIIDPPLLEHAWKIQDRYRFSFWDSLIVAAAKAASCRWLLTEDLQPGQNLDGIIVVNPFLYTPDQLPV